jgi:hypothetical protein
MAIFAEGIFFNKKGGMLMVALIIGLLFIAAAVWAVLPESILFGRGWGEFVIVFLKGGAPILAFLIGIIAFFIGIADIKDKIEAKKEEETANKEDK